MGHAAPLGAVLGDLRPGGVNDKPEAHSGLLTVALESGGGAPLDARSHWNVVAQLLPQWSSSPAAESPTQLAIMITNALNKLQASLLNSNLVWSSRAESHRSLCASASG